MPKDTQQASSSDEDDGSFLPCPSVMSEELSDSSMDDNLSAASSLGQNAGQQRALVDFEAAMEVSPAMAEPASNMSRGLEERADQVDLDVAARPSLAMREPDSPASSALDQQEAASADLETVKRLHRLLSAVPAGLKADATASQVWSTGRVWLCKEHEFGHIKLKLLALDLYHAGV